MLWPPFYAAFILFFIILYYFLEEIIVKFKMTNFWDKEGYYGSFNQHWYRQNFISKTIKTMDHWRLVNSSDLFCTGSQQCNGYC